MSTNPIANRRRLDLGFRASGLVGTFGRIGVLRDCSCLQACLCLQDPLYLEPYLCRLSQTYLEKLL